MPYFSELRRLIEDAELWADLRHEQGADVGPVVEKLAKDLRKYAKKFRKLDAPALDAEPDKLDEIRALRPEGPRRMTESIPADFKDRLEGAWLGRCAGCTLGAPVEAWSVEDMERLAKSERSKFPPVDYWQTHPQADVVRYGTSTMRDYLRGRIKAVPVDDDVAYTVLGLLILEEYGVDFETRHVAEAWIKYVPVAYTAERVTLDNLMDGILPDKAGEKRNPYQEWIGADIRSDPWAYVAPAWPEKAAELAWRDASLSHRRTGIYGAMFFAAAISAAFAVDDPMEAIQVGLTEIPADCRLARHIRWALDTTPTLKDWRDARRAVDERFPGMHAVHTVNNACLTIFGLSLGGRDFTKTIGTTVAMGLDNDCTAATAGSLLGAVIGKEKIPEHWYKPFHNRTRTYLRGFEWFSNSDIVKRFMVQAKKIYA